MINPNSNLTCREALKRCLDKLEMPTQERDSFAYVVLAKAEKLGINVDTPVSRLGITDAQRFQDLTNDLFFLEEDQSMFGRIKEAVEICVVDVLMFFSRIVLTLMERVIAPFFLSQVKAAKERRQLYLEHNPDGDPENKGLARLIRREVLIESFLDCRQKDRKLEENPWEPESE